MEFLQSSGWPQVLPRHSRWWPQALSPVELEISHISSLLEVSLTFCAPGISSTLKFLTSPTGCSLIRILGFVQIKHQIDQIFCFIPDAKYRSDVVMFTRQCSWWLFQKMYKYSPLKPLSILNRLTSRYHPWWYSSPSIDWPSDVRPWLHAGSRSQIVRFPCGDLGGEGPGMCFCSSSSACSVKTSRW